jgi:hypothetical protein
MYRILVKLVLLAAFLSCGISYSEFFSCHSRECLQTVEKRSRDVLKIDWKPISVFPEEDKRFLPARRVRR